MKHVASYFQISAISFKKICWSSWISLLPPPPTSIKQHPDFYLHSLLFLGVRKRG